VRNTIDPSKGGALSVGGGCEDIRVAGNTVAGREQRADDVSGEVGPARFDMPVPMDHIGPPGLGLDGAMHLAIPRLRPWKDDLPRT
jgi:hypothetical protein